LRHSCATILLRAGVDIHRVQRILRHASVTTTSGTYAYLGAEGLREALSYIQGSPESERTHRQSEAARAVSGTLPASHRSNENPASRRGRKPLMTAQIVGRALQELNLRPSGSKPDALSS
jgi:hypothetical protein